MYPTMAYLTGGYDWLIIAGIVLVLFGGTKLPQLDKGLGEGIREFKKSVNGEDVGHRDDVTHKDDDTHKQS